MSLNGGGGVVLLQDFDTGGLTLARSRYSLSTKLGKWKS